MLVQLAKLALVLLFESLHPCFDMLGGTLFGRLSFSELVGLPPTSLRT